MKENFRILQKRVVENSKAIEHTVISIVSILQQGIIENSRTIEEKKR